MKQREIKKKIVYFRNYRALESQINGKHQTTFVKRSRRNSLLSGLSNIGSREF